MSWYRPKSLNPILFGSSAKHAVVRPENIAVTHKTQLKIGTRERIKYEIKRIVCYGDHVLRQRNIGTLWRQNECFATDYLWNTNGSCGSFFVS